MKKMLTLLLSCLLLTVISAGQVGAAESGGTFKFCLPYGGQVFSLDPHKSTRTQDRIVQMNINRSLYEWDAETNKPVLALADSVDVSEDAKTYTYHLKKNIQFHNGRNVTADDIIWSYERIMDAKQAFPAAPEIRIIKGALELEEGKADHISGLKKIDDYTLQITLKNPIDPSYNLFQINTAILPKEVVEAKGDVFALEPVGCGPFKFVKWVKGSQIDLEKFDGYYEAGRPYLDKLELKIISENAALDMAFKAKELDATIVGANQYIAYQRDPEISKNLIEVAEMYTRLMVFNTEFEPLKDKRVRQAINYAIRSDLIIKKYLKGKAFETVSYLPTTSPAFDPNRPGYKYDLEKAKQLMKEAGYEKGFTLNVLTTSSKSYGVGVVEAIIPFLKKINITVKPQMVEGAVVSESALNGNFEGLTWSLESGPDPLQMLMRFHKDNQRSSGNYPAYNSAKFSSLLDQASKEMDYAKKMDLVKQADAVMQDEAPFWFFNYNKAIIAYHPYVHGIQKVAPEMMYQDLSKVWLDKK